MWLHASAIDGSAWSPCRFTLPLISAAARISHRLPGTPLASGLRPHHWEFFLSVNAEPVDNARSGRKHWLKLLFNLVVLALLFYFVRDSIRSAIEQLRAQEESGFRWRLQWTWVVVSGGLYLLGSLPMGWFWYRILRALGQHPRPAEALRAFYIGHLGKYVPGKALVIILRAGLLKSERVSAAVAAASVFLETLTMMAVGAFLSAGILALRPHEDMRQHGWLLPLALGLMVAAGLPTVPPIFRRLVLRLGVPKGDPGIVDKINNVTWRLVGTGWLAMIVGWLLLGLSLWATLQALGVEGVQPIAHLHYYTAAVALAMVAGFLSLIPGGVLVREVILMSIMGIYLAKVLKVAEADAIAVVSAVLLRLIWLVSELIASGILYVGVRGAQAENVAS
ncbi:MAG: UPF0104 family protein [Planctomycetota bacterium]|nr:MAG: UPF0104 family protein [Planctomycetota bacterium]